MTDSDTGDYEDILGDSLEFLGGKRVVDDDQITYGPLVLSVAPKVRSASFHQGQLLS